MLLKNGRKAYKASDVLTMIWDNESLSYGSDVDMESDSDGDDFINIHEKVILDTPNSDPKPSTSSAGSTSSEGIKKALKSQTNSVKASLQSF